MKHNGFDKLYPYDIYCSQIGAKNTISFHKGEEKMKKKATLGSDHFQSTFNVTVEDFGMKAKGDDGRAVHEIGDPNWHDTTIYNGVLDRRDGKFQLQMQWVDLQNDGHRIVLPHQVVEAIHRAYSTIIKKSKSEGAKKAAETRAERGIVDFAERSN